MGSRGGQSNYHKGGGGSRSRSAKRFLPSVRQPKPQKQMSAKEKRAKAKAEKEKAKAERAAKRDRKYRDEAAKATIDMKGIDAYKENHGFSSRKEAAVFLASGGADRRGSAAVRADAFGITKRHYMNPYLAKKWYKEMARLVHPDNNKGNNRAHAAMSWLANTYSSMIR